jgi:hypothetical protein
VPQKYRLGSYKNNAGGTIYVDESFFDPESTIFAGITVILA